MTRDSDTAPETAFSAAIEWLQPGASASDVVKRFGWRTDRTTVANWRSGRRRAPRWAIDAVRLELRTRYESLDRALAQIKERPGLQAGKINLAKYLASRNRDNT
jgi:hypothetical protein